MINENCPICHDNITPPVGIPSCCSHKFCFSCISTWAGFNSSCPLDRQRFSEIMRVEGIDDSFIETVQLTGNQDDDSVSVIFSLVNRESPINSDHTQSVIDFGREFTAMENSLREFIDADINPTIMEVLNTYINPIHNGLTALRDMEEFMLQQYGLVLARVEGGLLPLTIFECFNRALTKIRTLLRNLPRERQYRTNRNALDHLTIDIESYRVQHL